MKENGIKSMPLDPEVNRSVCDDKNATKSNICSCEHNDAYNQEVLTEN